MTRPQQMLVAVLDRIPVWELSVDARNKLDGIKSRIDGATDLRQELSRLYRVQGFGNLALGLLWVAGRAEHDSSRIEASIEEEELIVHHFRSAVGELPAGSSFTPEVPAAPPVADPFAAFTGFSENPFGTPPPDPFASFPAPSPEPTADTLHTDPFAAFTTAQPDPFGFGTPPEQPAASFTGFAPSGDNGDEMSFSTLLERFLEAVQSGSDDRTSLLEEVKGECQGIGGNSAPEEFRQFCQLLSDFLEYILVNQYLDDVRVMNLVTNIQEPFASWAKSPAAERQGLLDQAIEMLRDFRSMFE